MFKLLYNWVGKLARFFIRHIEMLLISALIVVAAVQYYVRPQSQSYDQVLETGKLRVLITDEPDSQYVFDQKHYGFEYEILNSFAASIGVELELEIVPYGQLFTRLSSGDADIAVGGILDSNFVRRVSTPTVEWYQAQTTVVYRRGTQRPKEIDDLGSEPVLASARYYEIDELEALNLRDDHRSEYDLLNAVAMGAERFALSTNYRARNARHYLPELNRSFILPDTLGVVWALPKRHDVKLLNAINNFLNEIMLEDIPQILAENYFKLPKRLHTYDALAIHKDIQSVLPSFEYAFRKAAREGGVDWQLLAAIAYQESHWSNDAQSPTGVRGIMQLTNDTADFLGVDDRLDMSKSIDAAGRYLLFLKSRIPEPVEEPDRTWFAVGAYNMGLQHIKFAYKKAQREGLQDPQKWDTVSQLLPQLYGKPSSNGKQAQTYVERVRIFTDILRFYDLHQRDQMILAPLEPQELEELESAAES